MDIVLGLLGASLVLVCILFGTSLYRIRQLRWRQQPACHPLDQSLIDPVYLETLTVPINRLIALGFEKAYWLEIFDPLSKDTKPNFACVLIHPQHLTHAEVVPHPLPQCGDVAAIEFYHFLEDGRTLLTTNGTGHCYMADVKDVLRHDAYTADLNAHLSIHLKRYESQSVRAKEFSPGQYSEWLNEYQHAYLQQLIDLRHLVAADDNQFRLSYRGAFNVIKTTRKGQTPLQRMMAERRNSPPEPMSVEAEVIAHQRQVSALGDSPRGSSSKLLLLGVSVVLFLLSFGFRLEIETLVILVFVLLLHEAGHLLAMQLFGYRDLQILFIPFLGAVAMGKKTACPAWQKAVIDLAGPVPGIVLAAVLWSSGLTNQYDWMESAIGMLLLLNVFNLLPIHPLDGGQLTNLLVFQRWPNMQLLFVLGSISLFLWGSWKLQSPILALLGFFLAFTVRYQYAESKLLAKIRKSDFAFNEHSDTDQLRKIYRAMQDLQFQWSFADKWQTARNVKDKIGAPLAKGKETFFGMGFYLIVLLGTPYAFWSMEYPPLLRLVSAENQNDWESEYDNAISDEERVNVLIAAAYDRYWDDDYQKAIDLLQRANPLLENLKGIEPSLIADVYLARAINHFELFLEVEKPASTTYFNSNELDQAIKTYEGLARSSDSDYQLVDAYELKAEIAREASNWQEALAFYRQAEAIMTLDPPAYEYSLLPNIREQAEVYRSMGDNHSAESRYLDMLEFALARESIKAQELHHVMIPVLEYYLDEHKYGQALELSNAHFERPEKPQYSTRQLLTISAWAHLKLMHYDEALAAYYLIQTDLEKHQKLHPKFKPRFQFADTATKMLLVNHAKLGGGSFPHDGKPQEDYQFLLKQLKIANKTMKEYLKHLDCECNREAGGYRLEQSLRMRDIVNLYRSEHHP